MKFKSGVRIRKFMNTAVMQILQAVENTAPEDYEPTITSANDGKHQINSLHPKNKAFDIRTRDFPGFSLFRFKKTRHLIDAWIVKMRNELDCKNYDIIFGIKNHKNHIHIEFDPKDY